jgi:signal transduction histidine kinase
MFQKHVGVRLQKGEGLSGRIWAEARPLSIDNYRFWNGRAGAFEGDPIGPAMGVPMYVDGKVTGVIGLTRLVYSKSFTEDELDAMSRLAELAGILLTNARLRSSLETELAARVDAQAALQVAYEGLEQRVQVRTAELAALHARERERRAEAERSRRIADGLREIVAALNTQQSLDETLDFIVSHACRMLKSDGAAIFRLEQVAGGEPALRVQAGCGLTPGFVESASLPYHSSIAGRSLREGRAIPVPDIRRQIAVMSDDLAPSPYLQRPEMQLLMASFAAMLLTPLTVGRQPYGVMALYYRKSRPFAEEDINEAQSLADQTALAIESARLREQAGEAAALDERNRLARELHDSVTQSLYSVTLYAEAAARQMEAGNDPAVIDHLRDLRDTSRDALREMRLLIYELRPPEIERTGLAAALRARLQAVETRGGVRAELIQDGDENIPAAVQQELYHIAREALNNSLKHSLANHLTVRLFYRPDETALEVEDDGAGFDSEAGMEAGGMGLRTMRERAQRLGAELELRTALGQGTLVRVTKKAQTGQTIA